MASSSVRRRKKEQDSQMPSEQEELKSRLATEFGSRLTPLENGAWNYNLTYGVRAEGSYAVFKELKENKNLSFNMLIDITAVDWLDSREDRFQVVYQLLSLTYGYRLCVKIDLKEVSPETPSVVDLWPAANFLEREVWDMFGIGFSGHGDLRRILMYDEFVGHPLRKDYPVGRKQPRIALRVPELANTSADMRRAELVNLPSRKHGG